MDVCVCVCVCVRARVCVCVCACEPRGTVNKFPAMEVNGQIEPLPHLSRCSTPTSSASSAPISLPTCSYVFVVGVPS